MTRLIGVLNDKSNSDKSEGVLVMQTKTLFAATVTLIAGVFAIIPALAYIK
jgi:hypothetical protein